MKTAKLITCNTIIDAHFIKVRLNNAGIECFTTNENSANLLPMFNYMLGSGVQIIVDKNDLEAAQEVIKDKLTPRREEMICSYCSSENIKLGMGEKRGLKLLYMFLGILIWIPMGNLRPKYYCEDCGKEIE